MTTRQAQSPDGITITYDIDGSGPPLMLLHGGFVQNRTSWRDAGWIAALSDSFKIVSVDLRGHGASSQPRRPEAYTFERIEADLRAVLDAERVLRAALLGYSFGAIVALRFASRKNGVSALALLGGAFGPPIPETMRLQMLERIDQVTATRDRGETLSLLPHESDFVARADLEVAKAVYTAMSEWHMVEPENLICPTLFVAGTSNPWSMDSIDRYGRAWRPRVSPSRSWPTPPTRRRCQGRATPAIECIGF